MTVIFQGRPVLSGNVEGEALVTPTGFNILASFKLRSLSEDGQAVCADQNNQALYGKIMTGKILCLPQTIGSTTGGLVLQTTATLDLGPKALLFSRHIDSLAASGIVLADIWQNHRLITVDQLGDDFLSQVRDGQHIAVREDGRVIID